MASDQGTGVDRVDAATATSSGSDTDDVEISVPQIEVLLWGERNPIGQEQNQRPRVVDATRELDSHSG
jgi:hypothetical protein